jgi:hypothetical protein
MTDYTFNQLIDSEQVRQLLESHHRLSGMAYGLFDTDENNLIAVGWQDTAPNPLAATGLVLSLPWEVQ